MNVQEYISSGILELYISGVLLEAENVEVAAMMEKHPEVKSEVEAIEKDLIHFSERLGTDMPDLKNNILAAIPTNASQTKIERENPSIAKDSESTPIQKGIAPWWRYAAAASILLLLGSLLSNYYFFNQWQESKGKVIALQSEKTVLADEFKVFKTNYTKKNSQLEIIRKPGTKVIELSGQKIAPESKAIVYWNPEEQSVYLDANQMPTPPPGKVYQLWSLKLDPLTPKDAGLLSDYQAGEDNFLQLKNVTSAEAFAITLEPAGGSVNPTLEQLYVIGNL